MGQPIYKRFKLTYKSFNIDIIRYFKSFLFDLK